jgi:hypothetical protein
VQDLSEAQAQSSSEERRQSVVRVVWFRVHPGELQPVLLAALQSIRFAP